MHATLGGGVRVWCSCGGCCSRRRDASADAELCNARLSRCTCQTKALSHLHCLSLPQHTFPVHRRNRIPSLDYDVGVLARASRPADAPPLSSFARFEVRVPLLERRVQVFLVTRDNGPRLSVTNFFDLLCAFSLWGAAIQPFYASNFDITAIHQYP